MFSLTPSSPPLSSRLTARAFIAAHTTSDSNFTINDECPICLDNYTTEKCLQITNVQGCSHRIGLACLTKMLSTQPHKEKKCPLCRTIWIAASSTIRDDGLQPLHGTSGALTHNLNHTGQGTEPQTRHSPRPARIRREATPFVPNSDLGNFEADIQDFNNFTREVETVRSRARQTSHRAFPFVLPTSRLQGGVSGAGTANNGQAPPTRYRSLRLNGDSSFSTAGVPSSPPHRRSLFLAPGGFPSGDLQVLRERIATHTQTPPDASVSAQLGNTLSNDSQLRARASEDSLDMLLAATRSALPPPPVVQCTSYVDLTRDSETPHVQAQPPQDAPGNVDLTRDLELDARTIHLKRQEADLLARTREVENRERRVEELMRTMRRQWSDMEDTIKRQRGELGM